MYNNTKLSMKNDYIFKRVFTKDGNEEFLKDFLTGLLKIEINEIEIQKDVTLEKDLIDGKLGILDVKAKINNKILVDIELQVRDEKNIIKRAEFYGSKIFDTQLYKNQNYNDLMKVYVIVLLDYKFLDRKEYLTESILVAKDNRNVELVSNIKYYYIELPKFRKHEKNLDDKLEQWLIFIDDEKEIDEVMQKNEKIKDAKKEYEYLTGDAREKRLAELREKYELDMASAIWNGVERGKKEGKEEGKEEEKINTAKALLNKKIPYDFISEITKLSIDEIKKLDK